MRPVIETWVSGKACNLYGKDLRCPVCGTGAKDVAPDYRLDGVDLPRVCTLAIVWTCEHNHRQVFGWERR